MEHATATDSSNADVSKLPAIMQYDNAIMSFADARLQYKNSILKYRNLIRERELSNLKKLKYVDVDQFVPSLERNVPQLSDQNDKRKQFIEDLKPRENITQINQCLHDELNMMSQILKLLELEKGRRNLN